MKETNFQTFARYCRYNSGAHMCDSGGVYGRHYEKPDIAENVPAVVIEADYGEIGATIETAHFLDAAFTIDRDLMRRFQRWQKGKDSSWFELATRYAEDMLHLHSQARDNVYNGENDLTQVYVWEVFTAEENPSDWLYDDSALVIVHVHTGCDVRGGYSPPLFCRSRGEYAIPIDYQAEYIAIEARRNGQKIERPWDEGIGEHWSVGYSGYPAGAVRKDVKRIFGFTKTPHSVCALLNSGEIVKISAELPYMGS